MSVSLYAIGSAKIEVGQFGTDDVNVALSLFIEICKKVGIEPIAVHTVSFGRLSVIFNFKDDLDRVLGAVAEVVDLHGDPPDEYILEHLAIPENEYVMTGEYND